VGTNWSLFKKIQLKRPVKLKLKK